ncbi:MAG TPA: cyclase family protein, partial [Ktedonobacteraceae bacterium]|nr:cyclase family protein [Ktedonobacteraceae bacterium]
MPEQTLLYGSSVADLTQMLENGMPAGAGLPGPEFTDLARVETDGYGMSKFVFAVNHVGTHIDAPTHIVRGKTLT